MKYSKPEVNTLGEATTVIQNPLVKYGPPLMDGVRRLVLTPAYDLDE